MKSMSLRAALAVVCGLVAFLLMASGVLDSFENKSWDWRLRAFATSTAPETVAILAVDQASLDYVADEQGLSWPWPRGLWVPIVEYCRSAGATGVVFDVLFTEFSSYGLEDDAEFASVMGQQPDIVLGSADKPPLPELAGAAAGVGNVSFKPDADGIFRRMPLIEPSSGARSLPFVAGETLCGLDLKNINGQAFLGENSEQPIPTDALGNFVVPYRGPAQTVPSYAAGAALQSFIRSMEGTGEIPLPQEKLQGRVVFVGLTAPGLLDLRPTPLSAVYPGVEVHATVLDALLRQDFIRVAPRGVGLVLSLLASLGLALGLGKVQKASHGLLLLPLALLILGALVVLGFKTGYWIPFVAPGLALILTFLAIQTLDYATEGRQRRFLKQAFHHYLSPQVVDQLVEDPSKLKLGGERKELSIFFSDLAGFTTLSEGLEPEALTSLLNQYLTAMTKVILDTGGTVDKYEGDAIIAFWNAPLDQFDHVNRAVEAGLRCLEELDRINPSLARLSQQPLSMRVGIHTGMVVVGNLGSDERFDYSMIGDAANLASRLEGLGKVFRSPILVSGATWDRCTVAYGREVGTVRVVGRSEPVRVFQPTGIRDQTPTLSWWKQGDAVFTKALEFFDAGDLDQAAAKFKLLPDDPVAQAYLARIQREAGRVENWSPIWEMTHK